MSDVELSIGGRPFKVACAPGEEAHIAGLGRAIDEKLRTMGGAAGQSESRMLLFAALLLADELDELRRGAAASPPPPPPPPPAPVDNAAERVLAALPPRIEAIAARVEKLAERLEAEGSTS